VRRRWCRRAIVAAGVAVCVAFVWLWLSFQRIPGWYRPVRLGPDDETRIRREATAWADHVSDRIVNRREFTIEVSEHQINEFLAALPEVMPEARRYWPAWLVDPAVVVEEGGLRIGVKVTRPYWSCIVSGRMTAAVSDDGPSIRLAVGDLRCGGLPLPDGLARRLASSAVAAAGSSGASGARTGPHASDVLERTWINRLTWPNGRRPIQIIAIESGGGMVRVVVRPL